MAQTRFPKTAVTELSFYVAQHPKTKTSTTLLQKRKNSHIFKVLSTKEVNAHKSLLITCHHATGAGGRAGGGIVVYLIPNLGDR